MSPSIKQKKAIPVSLVALALACFAISRGVQAAQPPDIQNVNVFNTPFQRFLIIAIAPGLTGTGDSVDIPAGKTLVVEFVSVYGVVPAGEQLTRLIVTSPRGGGAYLLWNFQASERDRDIFVASQQIRLYARDSLGVSVDRDLAVGTGVINVLVNGYLVNTP
ncbi:MAG: hypothetical protein E6L08_05070 [Verrucomicrobia bacterium]|nr:MAG: hypothetical protein E6L08_05070 [Verrucomicrobiota bacterium]